MSISLFRLPGASALVVLLCLACLVMPEAWSQQQPAGRVTITLGSVEAVASDGSVRRLQRGDPIFQGDTLRTGPQGRGQIRFTDRGMLSLRPDTVLLINDYDDGGSDPAAGRQELNLDRGGFRTQTGRIAQANRQAYRIQTPVAVIGIRGTVFDAHQEVGGALVVGASQGGVEVQSSSGISGRIGAGEAFNFLRVNPDGSIEFLLEAPDAFSVTPGFGDRDDDEEADALDAGDGDVSSVDSTAGTDPIAGADFVSQTTSPESTGIVSSSETGSGLPPTTEPLDPVDPIDPVDPVDPVPIAPPPPPPAVLSTEQTAALLADDRFGLVIGAQGVTLDAEGNLQPGPEGMFGGLATFNSPLLALDSGRSGLGEGIADSDRQALLDAADIFLLPGSGEFTLEENKGGVTGLVWGRYAAPVTVFVDALDNTKVLELDRELLFVLGTPTDIADLEGIFFYELSAWDAISSGLPIAGIEASGSLDLGTGVYAGFLDVLLGADGFEEFSLFAEFSSQVSGGVLEGIQFGVFDLFEFATETTTEAEGTLAGFFTGNAAAFLQLAFDFRVPSRNDADVRGLVLLEQMLDLPEGALTPAEATLLDGGILFVAVSCCFSDAEGAPTGTFGGFASDPAPSGGADTLLGINLIGTDEAAEPLDPEFVLFPPDVVIRRNTAPTVADVDYGDSVFGFEWQGQNGPVLAHDAVTGEIIETFGQSLQVITGIPTPTANLVGSARFELQDFSGFALLPDAAGFQPGPLTEVELSFNVDFSSGEILDGLFLGNIDLNDGLFAAESGTSTLFALFGGQVAFANGNSFVAFEIFSGGVDIFGSFDELDFFESDLSGFFTGTNGDRFATAFRFQTIGENFLADGPAPLLAIGTAVLGRQELALTPDEEALFGNGLGFVATDCCTLGGGVGAGLAIQINGEWVGGFNVGPDGEDLLPLDPGFLNTPPDRLLRRAGAFELFAEPDPVFGADVTRVLWHAPFSPALIVDATSGEIDERLDEFVLFQTALPADIANLLGFTTFAGDSLGMPNPTASQFGLDINGGVPISLTGSFNVDFATGDIFAGHLFVVDFVDSFGGQIDEFGFEVFFDGFVGIANGNPFAELEILDGAYHERTPLDLFDSELVGFFSSNPAGTLFHGAYSLHTEAGNPESQSASGVFTLSNFLLPETRLLRADVETWSRVGIASFETSPFFPVPGDGLLLGRAGAVPAVNGDPDFVLGANALVSAVSDTARRGFWAQPFEFVLRRDTAFETIIDIDAKPPGAPSFAGFEVGWGRWDGFSGDGAFVQIDPANATQGVTLESLVFFASVNPTPTSQLPRTGLFAYDGPTAFIGVANGDISGSFNAAVDGVAVSFLLDFTSGDISDGSIMVDYLGLSETLIRWDGDFEGFLNGGITDLELTRLDLLEDFGVGFESLGPADLFSSNLTGVLTGPGGERHVGGFSFFFEDFELALFETTFGAFVVDRVNGGP